MRIGLLGGGRIASRMHLPVLLARRDVRVVALAERNDTRRGELAAAAPDAALFDDYRALLSGARVDAVVVALPNALHADAAAAAFERGLHVYLEKPIATTLEDADRVIDAWRAAETVGRIGFNLRFHPLVAELRDAVRGGVVGEPVGIRTIFSAARRHLPDWKRERRSGGGALLDLASHHFDLAAHMLDSPIDAVSAMVRSVETEEDTAVATIRLENGLLGTTLVSIAAIEEDRIEIYGAAAGLVFDRYRSRRLRTVPPRRDFGRGARLAAAARTIGDLPRRIIDALTPPTDPSFGRALAEFVEACAGGTGRVSHAADLRDGRRSLAAVLSAEESARTGRTAET